MLKLSSIKRDLVREDEGEWIDIVEWPGVRFKVRSINCRDYQIQRENLVQRLSRTLKRFPTTPEMEPQLARLVARFLLLDWEGLEDGGTRLEYSPERALELLTDPGLTKLEEQVIWAATQVGERNAEFSEDAAKNSAALSVTS